jgi:hypothetical protein
MKLIGWGGSALRKRKSTGAEIRSVGEEIKKEGFRDVLVLGMGGSSLCPEVLALTFGPISGYPKSYVLIHRSRSGQGIREESRCCENIVCCLQQIGKYAGTKHFQAILF